MAAFEARLPRDGKVSASHGGEPLVALHVEVPWAKCQRFGTLRAIVRGERVVVFLTGVGTRALFDVVENRYTRAQFVEALSKVVVVARGPKPVSALRGFGVPITVAVPEPNTWRELLETMDASERCPALKGLTGVQEYWCRTPNFSGAQKREPGFAGSGTVGPPERHPGAGAAIEIDDAMQCVVYQAMRLRICFSSAPTPGLDACGGSFAMVVGS